MAVTSDGSCLFYSVAFAFLFPVARDAELFRQRFVSLFGAGAADAAEENRQFFICNNGREIIQNPEILQILVNDNLRKQVVTFMRAHKEKFLDFIPENENFEARMQKIENPDKRIWGDQPEIAAMSEMLQVNMAIYRKEGNILSPLLGASHNIFDGNTEICLLYTQAIKNTITSNSNNHYNYLLREQDLPIDKIFLQKDVVDTAASWQAEIRKNARELGISFEGKDTPRTSLDPIPEEPTNVESDTDTQTNNNLQSCSSSNNLLPNFSSISINRSLPFELTDISQLTENDNSSSQATNIGTGPKISTKQARVHNIRDGGYYVFTKSCEKISGIVQKGVVPVTNTFLYAYKNTSKIKNGFYQLVRAAGREGLINGLQRVARTRCSLDGTSRL